MMKDYLLGSLILPEIRFVEWSIQSGDRLSAGSLLFTYENVAPIDGKTRTFKYKCDLNGITVTRLSEIKGGDVLKTGVQLFSYEGCNHSISTNDMCGICGIDLRKIEGFLNKNKIPHAEKSSAKPGTFKMIHTETGVVVDHKEALEIARKDLVNLVENKKLVLLVDLDHTLIHTTNERVSNELKEVYHYELGPRGAWYHTKFRPGYQAFLDEMHEMYQMHLITFGERKYAHMIAGFMDPNRKFFHDRILSRNEIFNPISKTDNIKDLFPRGDLMVCIIDDREDVWNYARNLICVQPYVFFKSTGDINDPHLTAAQRKEKENEAGDEAADADTVAKETESTKDEETNEKASNDIKEQTPADRTTASKVDDYDPDDYLVYLKQILKQIHDEYYKIYETRRLSKGFPSINAGAQTVIEEKDLPDLKRVVPLIKLRVLEGVVITFSGVIPTGYDLRKQRCYMMAVSLGAKVNEDIVLTDEDEEAEEDPEEAAVTGDEANAKKYEYVYDDESNSSGGDLKYDDDETSGSSGNDAKKKKKRYTTHLVAAKFGTSKVHEALKSKRTVHVVTPEWLINCNYRWTKCDESQFKLTKDYDYKNCLFHTEYNLHQKCAASRATATTTNQAPQASSQPDNSSQNVAPRVVECCPKFNAKSANIKHSLSSSSFSESQRKKHKANDEEPESNSIPVLDEELLKEMDQEVLDELDGDDDDEEEDEEEFENESSEDSDDEGKNKAEDGKKKVQFDLTSSSSSSTLNEDLDDDSIDDEMIMALERDLAKND